MPDITVHALAKRFGAEHALDGVSFEVRDGEFLTLLGPSGCGKTTTLMSIAGFVRPDAGRIACGDRTFFDRAGHVHLPPEERNLGMVFQSYALWPHMTVAGNVGFPLKVRKARKSAIQARVRETLDLVEMLDYAGRYPHELSGGQQQRVALARALAFSPSVLLLDEPFSNLDAKLRERARTWLRRLQRELGLTTVFVTHDQDEALTLSDRILVMEHGVIVQAGTPEEVYRQPATRFVAEFVGQCNVLRGRVTAVEDERARIAIGDTTAELVISAPAASVGDALELAVRPEAISLAVVGEPDAHDPAENTFTAEIRGRSFHGDHYLYQLDAGSVELLAADTRSFGGSRLRVRIPPAACRVLARPAAPQSGPDHARADKPAGHQPERTSVR